MVAMRDVRPVWKVAHVDNRGNSLIQQFLVEHTSDASWWDYVRKRILTPAGLRATSYGRAENRKDAIPYDRTRRILERDAAATPDRSDGIRSTVGDFFRYSQALDDGRLLSQESQTEMTALVPGSRVRGQYGNWRYGWLVTRMFYKTNGHGETATELVRELIGCPPGAAPTPKPC